MTGLNHYQQFKDLLSAYQPSKDALKALEGLKLALLIAPTGGGRNTIINHQVDTGRYYYIVSDTTREPRINDEIMEQNGREYWFRSEEDMLADLKAGLLLEAELIHNQQVSGISIRELQKAQQMQKTAITDVDIEGIHNILRVKPDAIPIMVVPPGFEEWQRRLSARGRMLPDEQKRRLETAVKIFEDGLRQDYYRYVISEDVMHSAAIMDDIVEGKPSPHQGRARDMLQHLQSNLNGKLSHFTL